MTETLDRATTRTGVVIDFLYSEDCPSHERALELLHDVLREQTIQADVRVYEVETEEEAERLRFPGSPTIRVAGSDIEGDGDLPPALGCRAYRHPNGKISPLPPRESIAEALRRAV